MIDFRLVSCLDKVFCDEAPAPMAFAPEGLRGEEVSFQAAWRSLDPSFARDYVTLEIDSPIRDAIKLCRVRQVPVAYAWIPCEDKNYLRTSPGLYPDALTDAEGERLRVYSGHWEAAWLSIVPPEGLPAGEYPIRLRLLSAGGEVLAEQMTFYTLYDAALPKQKLIHTRWFHNDGLCSYYGVKMFSEEFWRIAENFIRAAADMSVNCLLTPVHTPPLDTRVGGERLTCQLVDIEKKGENYSFGFEKLERWIRLAQKCGIEYFEIAHFFTQWGAEHAPKIVARVDGQEKRIFGWETDAAGEEYTAFLRKYIPALRKELEYLGVLDKCLFHISDEPNRDHIESYARARAGIEEELKGLTVIDALSNIEFYEKGIVTKPVPASNHIRPFLEACVPGLWTYYCVGQFKDVSNAFIAMPSTRTRAIGLQMFKYGIEGFLQWGFNFYNSQYSDYPVNPWITTDGDGFTPAGDCFIVYPAPDGRAWPSIRAKVFKQAVQDMRALEALAEKIGRDETVKLVEECMGPVEFDVCPKDGDYYFRLRRKVNRLLAEG